MTLKKKGEHPEGMGTFLALQPDGLALMKANLGNFKISPWDMDKALVPTGGGTSWEVPDLEHGTLSVKTLEGIILHWMPYRRYYSNGLDEGGTAGPPDCFSSDGINGYGDPGGDCDSCELNAWGSGKNGGKACPESRLLFLLQPDAYLPMMLQLPRMSTKLFDQHLMRLASRGILVSSVVTRFTLRQAKQKNGGLTYSQAVPTMVRRLTDEEVEAVIGLMFKPSIPQQARQNALNG